MESTTKKNSAFLKIKCKDCSNEQPIFMKATTTVKCLVCGSTLSTPTGGKAKLLGEVVEELE